MNESYITNKVKQLLHVEHRTALQAEDRKKIIEDILQAMRGTIQDATYELESRIVKMLNLRLNQYLL